MVVKRESAKRGEGMAAPPKVCINEIHTDDKLRTVLAKLRTKERDRFGLVCKRWLRLHSSERRRLRARAGPVMLRRMADQFSGLTELDLSQSASRSFYPSVTDSDLAVIVAGFRCLLSLDLHALERIWALNPLLHAMIGVNPAAPGQGRQGAGAVGLAPGAAARDTGVAQGHGWDTRVVARLRKAGAVILGKASMSE